MNIPDLLFDERNFFLKLKNPRSVLRNFMEFQILRYCFVSEDFVPYSNDLEFSGIS